MMKRNLKLATTLALVLASSAALADGFSSLATIGTGVGGSAYGTEQGTQGGFCTGTGVMCGATTGVTTIDYITDQVVPTVADVNAVAGGGAIAAGTVTQSSLLQVTGALQSNAIESASGAGIEGGLSTPPATGVMAPISSVTSSPSDAQGTYTSLNAVTLGAYNNVGATDPGAAANVTGNTYALQKGDLGVANTGSTTSATATAMKGQAASFGAIATTAQAMTPVQ